MKKKSIFKYALFGALAVSIIGCQTDSNEDILLEVENADFQEVQPIEGSYIVVYNNVSGKLSKLPQVKSKVEYSNQISKLKTTFSKEFKSIDLKEEDISATFGYALNGFSAKLTDVQVDALKKDPRVKSVEQDFILSITPFKGPGHGGGNGGGGDTPDPQVIPYGTTRVGGGTTTS